VLRWRRGGIGRLLQSSLKVTWVAAPVNRGEDRFGTLARDRHPPFDRRDQIIERNRRDASVRADDVEVLADEYVVWPVDPDVVNLVLAVAQLHNTVDNAPRIVSQRSFGRLIC